MFKQAGKQGVKRQRIDNTEFVKTWLRCSTIEEVALAFDTQASLVSAKASSLRAKGVNLPKKLRNSKSEVDKLNDIIKKYNRS